MLPVKLSLEKYDHQESNTSLISRKQTDLTVTIFFPSKCIWLQLTLIQLKGLTNNWIGTHFVYTW